MCGGQVTEVEYVEYLQESLGLSAVSIRSMKEAKAPDQLIGVASQSTGEYDQVWVVCDVDDYGAKMQAAVGDAAARNVKLAVSNPCFEIWLIFHCESCGALSTAQAQKRAAQLGLTYGKNFKSIRVSAIRGAYNDADLRAKGARATHVKNRLTTPNDSPSSGVDLLVDAVIAAEKRRIPGFTAAL